MNKKGHILVLLGVTGISDNLTHWQQTVTGMNFSNAQTGKL